MTYTEHKRRELWIGSVMTFLVSACTLLYLLIFNRAVLFESWLLPALLVISLLMGAWGRKHYR
jgi:uncharacterized membrane protein YhhN